jgi:hypothetical protein
VAVADGLLARRRLVDGIERQATSISFFTLLNENEDQGPPQAIRSTRDP